MNSSRFLDRRKEKDLPACTMPVVSLCALLSGLDSAFGGIAKVVRHMVLHFSLPSNNSSSSTSVSKKIC